MAQTRTKISQFTFVSDLYEIMYLLGTGYFRQQAPYFLFLSLISTYERGSVSKSPSFMAFS